MKALVIINPLAGKGRGKNHLFPIVNELCKQGYSVTSFITQSKEDATHLVSKTGDQYSIIVCCGGDGTFQEVVSGVLTLKNRPAIGYIPCGTTNDLSKTLHLTHQSAKLLDGVQFPDNYIDLDIGHFNEQNFAYIASFGSFSSVSYETPQSAKSMLGHTAYVINGISQVPKIHPIHMRWRCDGLNGEGEYFFGGVTNSLSIGGIYKLPNSVVSLNDGMFELILVQSQNTNFDILPKLLTKQPLNESDKHFLFLKGREFVFEFDEAIPFTLDGEFGGVHKNVRISCENNAIRLLTAHSSKYNK